MPRIRYEPVYAVDEATGCWLWQGRLSDHGYAVKDQCTRVHIVHWVEAHGPVPKGLELDHLCRVRHCVNPDHLEPVTHAENVRRGRVTRLTWEIVREIRASPLSIRAAGRKYGMHHGYVSRIRNNLCWREEA